jgi:acetoin:2,6-dichlorophenolindophenol oxidoreductase subunit alpha
MITLKDRFGYMVWMREFELACLEGVPTREIHGELHTAVGQEAIGAGMAGFLRPDDALTATHETTCKPSPKALTCEPCSPRFLRKKQGLCGGFGGHMHLFDPGLKFSATGIVGAGLPVSAGHAWASRMRGDDSVSVAVIGDGAVNTGAFHEAMNFAGVHQLSMVVLVENNEWAISVPFDKASATPTVAERAPAWAASGVRVDGTDVEAVAEAFGEAVSRARAGGGPSLVEATCYRFRGHFEGDADTYRSEEEKDARRAVDPLDLAEKKLVEQGEASREELAGIRQAVKEAMATMLESVRADNQPPADHALRHVFVEVA